MKKITILSVLEEIRDILKNNSNATTKINYSVNSSTEFEIDFPEITAKEIYENCNNKKSNGDKLLYNIYWYKDEKFFTTETTRPGKRIVDTQILHKNKSWNECKKISEKERKDMLNFAELVYTLWWIEKNTKKIIWNNIEYSWSCSFSSVGYLVYFGNASAVGADVHRNGPDSSYDNLGVVFSRSVS